MKLWLRTILEQILLSDAMVESKVLKQSSASRGTDSLQIIIPHRLNWKLTTATVKTYQRFTQGNFSISVVANFDKVPSDWECLTMPNLTVIQNSFNTLGRLMQKFFAKENGSMANALALHAALRHEPDFEWVFTSHSDSAPVSKDWKNEFVMAMGQGFICGGHRDRTRIHAAHTSGTLLNQREFCKRNASLWPLYKRGHMIYDVGDSATLALHDIKKSPVPVLPNTSQDPSLVQKIAATNPLLAKFAENGSQVSFDTSGTKPVFAHLGRGTPRNSADSNFAHKLPVDLWIEMLGAL